MSFSPEAPIVFAPLFMERIWGGRRLESLFRKKIPAKRKIGESWEIVDRPEAQSVVRHGRWEGKTLHELWRDRRAEIFGAGLPETERFPLLLKLLDAEEKLSLQVHPPAEIAASLGGEPKSELWYFLATEDGAEIFAGLRQGVGREQFAEALRAGRVAGLIHRLALQAGESFFVPSGRLHGIGGGSVIVEIQQNSDTTYRVFDWDRTDEGGRARPLHIDQSIRSIRFDDYEPERIRPEGEHLLRCPHFVVEKWELKSERRALDRPAFAIFVCLSGRVACGKMEFSPGEFFLVPARAEQAQLQPKEPGNSLLRVTLPGGA